MFSDDDGMTSRAGTRFNGFVDDDGSSNDGFGGLVNDNGSGDMGRFDGCLGGNAVLDGFDGETGADGVVALVVNTEEGIVGLWEVGRNVEIDRKIVVNL